jgi:hypothetical protein
MFSSVCINAGQLSKDYEQLKSSCLLGEIAGMNQHTRTISIINSIGYIDDTIVEVEELPNSVLFKGKYKNSNFIIRYSKIDPINGSSVLVAGARTFAICSVYFAPTDTNSGVSIGGRAGGCGSRGGPGYRRPDGRCASWQDR